MLKDSLRGLRRSVLEDPAESDPHHRSKSVMWQSLEEQKEKQDFDLFVLFWKYFMHSS